MGAEWSPCVALGAYKGAQERAALGPHRSDQLGFCVEAAGGHLPGCTPARGRRPVCTLQGGSTRTSLACLGDVGRVRIGPVRTDPPSIRTRRDKVRPTARAHGNDNAPCSVVKIESSPFAPLYPVGLASLARRNRSGPACRAWTRATDLYQVHDVQRIDFDPSSRVFPPRSTAPSLGPIVNT